MSAFACGADRGSAQSKQIAQRRGEGFSARARDLGDPGFRGEVGDSDDSDGPRPERLAALQQWRDDIDALYQGHPPPRLTDYVASVRRFDLKREDFLAIVDGMEMDVPQDIRAPDLATLDLYFDPVASPVGRLSVRVFGLPLGECIPL